MTASDIWKKTEVVVLVTIVAILVWLYAEGESLKTETDTVRVQFLVANDVEIKPRELSNVVVKFSGPNRSVAQFKQLARQAIKISVEPDPDSITRELDLRARLEQDPAIRDLNIQINETTPPRQSVEVERKREYTAAVELDRAGLELTSDLTIEPAVATIRMTQTVRAYHDGDLKVFVRLSDVPNLESIRPNQQVTEELPLRLPEAINLPEQVAVTPRTATVSFRIRERTATVVKESIPIYVRMPVIVSNQYEIITENELRLLAEPVELTGPRAEIERIERNERQIYAELQLTTEDLERGVTSKPVHITTPPNVTVSSVIPTVRFTIRKRADATGS